MSNCVVSSVFLELIKLNFNLSAMSASPLTKSSTKSTHSKRTQPKDKYLNSVNKENPRPLKDLHHKFPSEVLEYIGFC